MEFKNLEVFKQVVKDHIVNNGVKVRFVKNDAKRYRVKCEDPCRWVIMYSLNNSSNFFQVKTYNNDYTCSRIMNTIQATSKWLAPMSLPFLRSKCKPIIKRSGDLCKGNILCKYNFGQCI